MKYRVELFKKLLAKYPNIPLRLINENEEYTVLCFGTKLLDPTVIIRADDPQQVELIFYKRDEDGYCSCDSTMMNMVDTISLLNLYFYD